MTWSGLGLSVGVALLVGVLLGSWVRDRIWRAKGDHKFMNRMESGGKIYLVREAQTHYDKLFDLQQRLSDANAEIIRLKYPERHRRRARE